MRWSERGVSAYGRQTADALPEVWQTQSPPGAVKSPGGVCCLPRWASTKESRKRLMDFKRKKKRGQSQKICRYWFSEDGYRIVWRREVYGVRVPTRFQATVRTIISNYGGSEGETFEMWDFADSKHRLFKVFGKAKEACERHKRLWTEACEATGIRDLIEVFGKLPNGIPLWAKKKLSRKVLEILTRPQTAKYRADDECEPDPDDPTGTSDSSAGSTEPVASVPILALPAREEDSVITQSTRTTKSSAPPVEERAKAPKKRAAQRTSKPSKPTSKKKRSTKGSATTGKKPSKGSTRKKSKPSKN